MIYVLDTSAWLTLIEDGEGADTVVQNYPINCLHSLSKNGSLPKNHIWMDGCYPH